MTTMMNSKDMALKIAAILEEKKGEDIEILKVDHLTSITDYFVIASGRNTIALKAMAEDCMEKMEELGEDPRRTEGMRDSRWIVLDYASVIVHIFHFEEREYYNIERLWMDGSNQVALENGGK